MRSGYFPIVKRDGAFLRLQGSTVSAGDPAPGTSDLPDPVTDQPRPALFVRLDSSELFPKATGGHDSERCFGRDVQEVEVPGYEDVGPPR